MKLFKRKPKHSCPTCGAEMHRKTGLMHTFNSHSGVPVEVPNITAMVCDKCNEMYFDWDEAQRIQEYVHSMTDTPVGVEEVQQ